MSLKCSLGIHHWNGCKCSTCGKSRRHTWSKDHDVCTQCGGVIEITTLADLQAITNDLGGRYRLMADIDATETKNWNSGKGFAPIGDKQMRFDGVLDGNGHTIRNLYINRAGEGPVGIFQFLSRPGEICRLTLVDIRVSGNEYVGSLVGFSEGKITECQASGEVSSHENMALHTGNIGGLVGFNSGIIVACKAAAAVESLRYSHDVGGLVGMNLRGTISDCQATGKVVGYNDVGGLVGINSEGTITECQASGCVLGKDAVGGLVAVNRSGDIDRCYAAGNVAGETYIGGLVGRNSDGNVVSCHAFGKVSGKSSVGGLAGGNSGDTVTKSYWDLEATGQLTSAGGGEGKTTSGMKQQATFVGWDFERVWQIDEGQGYPQLQSLIGKAAWQPSITQ